MWSEIQIVLTCPPTKKYFIVFCCYGLCGRVVSWVMKKVFSTYLAFQETLECWEGNSSVTIWCTSLLGLQNSKAGRSFQKPSWQPLMPVYMLPSGVTTLPCTFLEISQPLLLCWIQTWRNAKTWSHHTVLWAFTRSLVLAIQVFSGHSLTACCCHRSREFKSWEMLNSET